MKKYSEYQFLQGTEMKPRDVKEKGSKFWNEGKWANFVVPHIKEDPKGKIFMDVGCNSGLFLKLAEDFGFSRAIGIDSDEIAVKRGLEWRDSVGGKYDIWKMDMRTQIDEIIKKMPIIDYVTFVNAHYYFTVNELFEFIDQLQYKARYCIVVTDKKRYLNRCWASADITDIRNSFKGWEEVSFVDKIDPTGDPSPRELRSLCFKSIHIEKVPIDSLDSSNHVQDQFCEELDNGVDYKKTRYYRILKPYRKNWSEEKLNTWVEERIKVYNDIKENGLKIPIIVDRENKILDGNHRYAAIRHLGFKEIYVRRI